MRRGDRGFVFAAPHIDDVLAEHLFFLRFLVGELFAATLLEGRVDGRFRRRLRVFRPGLIGLVFGPRIRPCSRAGQFRIGVHVGDVMVDGENLLGDGVNIAARLEGLWIGME